MIDQLLKGVLDLVGDELMRARKEHGDRFTSTHEGYGVLAEEIWEAAEEARKVEGYRTCLIDDVHEENKAKLAITLCGLEDRAVREACECIQVAAPQGPGAIPGPATNEEFDRRNTCGRQTAEAAEGCAG